MSCKQFGIVVRIPAEKRNYFRRTASFILSNQQNKCAIACAKLGKTPVKANKPKVCFGATRHSIPNRGAIPMHCPICLELIAREVDSAGNVIEVECRRCGKFRYAGTIWEKLKKAPENKRAMVASWVWEQNRFGSVPTVDETNVDVLLSARPLPFIEKAKRLLIEMAEQSDRLGKPLDLGSPKLDAMVGTLAHHDIAHINGFLIDRGWVSRVTGGQYWMTGSGMVQADEWKQSVTASTQAFVAMWFDPSLEDAWTGGLRRGITDAGYKPLRIDAKEHANKICDEIISEIRRSRFTGAADRVGSVRRVPANNFEALVVKSVRRHLSLTQPIDDQNLVEAHVARVEVRSDQLIIHLVKQEKSDRKALVSPLHIAWRKVPATRRRELLLPEGASRETSRPKRSENRATLVASIARGRRWLDELTNDATASAEKIAEREGCSTRKVNMTISLAFLAPDLVKAAIDGRLPYGMGVARLADLSAEWSKQHHALGLPAH
ncbi:MAG: hypothetical protein WBE48_10615 [Xanthobacteraceae bacterium]